MIGHGYERIRDEGVESLLVLVGAAREDQVEDPVRRIGVIAVGIAKAGADVATMPYKVFDQLFKHPLTDKGLDQFLKDWEKAKVQ